jgi:hypothetical protein
MANHQHATEPVDAPVEDTPVEDADFVTEVLTYLIILDHDEGDA